MRARRLFRHVLFAIVFCVLVPIAARAQGDARLIVHVVDPLRAPVVGARIAVHSPDRPTAVRASTGPDGSWTFARLAGGPYLIEVEADGFASREATRVTLAGGTSKDVTIVVAAGVFETQVVVTASGRPESRSDVAKTVSVADESELVSRDAFTLGDAVRAMAGTRVQQLGGPGSETSIRLRGLRSYDTAVLVDGVPLRDASAPQGDATSFISDLLLTGISRVETLRGSGANIYGTNAIAGAVNLVSHAAGAPPRAEVLFEAGGLGLARSTVRLGHSFDENRVLVGLGVSGLNLGRGLDGDDRTWNTTVNGRATAQIGRASLSGFLSLTRAFTKLNSSPEGLDDTHFSADVNDPDSSRRARSSVGRIEWSDQITTRVGYSVTYHRVSAHRAFEDGPDGVGFQPAGISHFTSDGGVDTLRLRSDVRASAAHALSVMYQLEREHYRTSSLQPGDIESADADVTQWTHTVALQDRLTLLQDSLQITSGLRFQRFSLRTPVFSPATSAPYQNMTFDAPPSAGTGDVAAAYRVGASGPIVRAHVGTGYRAPSLFERFGSSFDTFFGYSVYGDPRLAPERSIGVDGGLEQAFPFARTRVSGSIFTTRIHDVIVFDFTGVIDPAADPFGRFGGYHTAGGARASGTELTIHTEPTRWLTIAGAHTFTTSRTDAGSAALSFGMPRHQASLHAVAHVTSGLDASALLTVGSSYLVSLPNAVTFVGQTYRLEGIRRLDLAGSYALPGRASRLRLFGRIDNVTNQSYLELGFHTPGRVAAAGVTATF